MVIFAHDIGHLAVAGLAADAVGAGVHLAVHVSAHCAALSLAVNRTRRIMLLEIPDHIAEQAVCIARIAGVFHFVSDRPCNDRRIVFQSLECGLRAVEAELIEQSHLPVVVAVHQRVAFHICFRHHIQAVIVAEPVEIAVIAVMRGADRVDVVLLHDADVFLDRCLRNGLAVEGIGIVTVDALEQQALAVDRDRLPALCGDAVGAVHLGAGEADLTEAELCGERIDRIAAAVPERQHERIEVRILRRPERRCSHLFRELECAGIAGADLRDRDRRGGRQVLAVSVQHIDLDRPAAACRRGCQIAHIDIEIQHRILITVIEIGLHGVIRNLHERTAREVDIAEDAAVIDHILILEPCAVAEFVYLDSKQILAALEIIGDIEAVRAEGVLAVADLHAVDIDIICGFDAIEIEDHAAVVLGHLRRDREGLAVKADRIVIRRGIRAADAGIVFALERHRHIRIDREVKALTGPAVRQGNGLPAVGRIR